MHSKLARKAIGALVSASFMVSMIPAMATADTMYNTEEIVFSFSNVVGSGDYVTVDGINLTVGGDETSQVSGDSNKYFGVAAGGNGTYTFSINESGAYAGCEIVSIEIESVSNITGCELGSHDGWSDLTAGTSFEWEGEATSVSFELIADDGNNHFFNYDNIIVTIQIPYAEEIHRLYNPNSGEHFYTADDAEAENLRSLGWNDEGIGWIAPIASDTPVFRLYNANAGEHHYTTDIAEVEFLESIGWTFENVAWFSDDSGNGVPVYRQYNPNEFANNHNYTTDETEKDNLISLGWQDENIGWYGLRLFQEAIPEPEMPVEFPDLRT